MLPRTGSAPGLELSGKPPLGGPWRFHRAGQYRTNWANQSVTLLNQSVPGTPLEVAGEALATHVPPTLLSLSGIDREEGRLG
jgi:hypothetical protein